MTNYRFKTGILLAGLLFFCATGALLAQGTDHDSKKLSNEQLVDKLFSEWNHEDTPGVALAIVKEGKVVFSKGYGMANLEYGIPITPQTVFHAASLSKQFTAYAILLLKRDGKLSLDDDIRKHIPEVPDFGKTITLKHLIYHMSGLRDHWRLLEMGGWRLDDVITNEQIFNLISRQKSLGFDPGERFSYSNTNYTLLAEVVARVSGKSFATFTKERIFKPLGMTNSLFYDDHQKIVKNRAYSYHKEGDAYEKRRLNYATVGATSLMTTVEDLSKWGLHLNDPKEKDKRLVEKLNTNGTLNNGEVLETAMGQFIGPKYGGLEWADHSGSDAGYRAYFSRFSGINSLVVILANSTPINAGGKALRAADVYLEEYYKKSGESGGTERKVFKHDPKMFIKLSAGELEAYAGKYWNPDQWYDREVYVKNDTLIYRRSASNETKLAPVGKNKFKMLGDTEDVDMIFDKDDKKGKQMTGIVNGGKDGSFNFIKYEKVDVMKYDGGVYYNEEVGSTYKLMAKDGKLYLWHLRLGEIPLNPINEHFFTSPNRNFRKVEVIRNGKGEIEALNVSNDGSVANMRFGRIK